MKSAFDQLISTFSPSGKEFEVLCKWILETDPVYANKLVDVWMWADWPNRWADQDLGIDLIANCRASFALARAIVKLIVG